jgi:hypothetical protein
MKKLKAPKLVTVSIYTTIAIVFWVFFSLYNVLISKPKVEIDDKLLDPINPTLDTETLNSLPSKTFFETDVASPESSGSAKANNNSEGVE